MEKKFWTPTSGVVPLSVILKWIRHMVMVSDAVVWSPEGITEGPVGSRSMVEYQFNGNHHSMMVERVE